MEPVARSKYYDQGDNANAFLYQFIRIHSIQHQLADPVQRRKVQRAAFSHLFHHPYPLNMPDGARRVILRYNPARYPYLTRGCVIRNPPAVPLEEEIFELEGGSDPASSSSSSTVVGSESFLHSNSETEVDDDYGDRDDEDDGSEANIRRGMDIHINFEQVRYLWPEQVDARIQMLDNIIHRLKNDIPLDEHQQVFSQAYLGLRDLFCQDDIELQIDICEEEFIRHEGYSDPECDDDDDDESGYENVGAIVEKAAAGRRHLGPIRRKIKELEDMLDVKLGELYVRVEVNDDEVDDAPSVDGEEGGAQL
ncbi:hypothetical protein B0H63DRAFT_552840 [Podospora didyma]|uniref:Uncharacterized protein n=1 Tax=Podospora didyma TaxID=330526 RepID=A0AAE0K735_9PEZI|nr:hypothetical protein B0H63DRAFT_552840 [Podospora didyma]